MGVREEGCGGGPPCGVEGEGSLGAQLPLPGIAGPGVGSASRLPGVQHVNQCNAMIF